MAVAGFGVAKFGGRGGWDRFKLKEGNNIYRLLPPMKTGVATGAWARYVGVHYGYKGIDKKDPTKAKARPFVCIQETNFKTKMVIQECPECLNIEAKKKELEFLVTKAEYDKLDGMSTKALVTPLKEWLKEHNCDRKWYINVKSESGKFGVLMIPHKGCKTALDQLILEIQQQHGFNPLSIERGVWFNFFRTGIDLTTTYAVKAMTVPVEMNGKRFTELKIDEMSDSEAQLALDSCPDLSEVAKTITFHQIRALVEGSGDPHEVDAILGASQSRGRVEQTPPTSSADADYEPDEPSETVSMLAPAVASAAPPSLSEQIDDEEAVLMAKLAAARAKKAAAVSIPAQEVAKVASIIPTATKISDDEFLKQFGG